MMRKILLDEDEIPRRWYNILADLPGSLDPMLNPQTYEPTELPPFLFASELNRQEFSTDRWIDIPEEVLEVYRIWRPTPLYRAKKLEEALKTPAKIYYKWEGVSPPGSHKPNTAVAQAYYNMKEGIERLTTETGAGQWGSALAFATKLFDLECMVYMVRVSYDQKPYRRVLMEAWGAEVVPSPSNRTKTGQKYLEEDPDSPGSLGVAISEAVEDAATNDNTHYTLGSVLNHVILHQTIMGLEAKRQFEMIDTYPDAIYGCVGGGSNFSGGAFPFLGDKLRGERKELEVVACEPTACPTLTKGIYAYDFGDSVGLAPIVKMYTLGHDFIPPKIHAGGLRYHGDAPALCRLVNDGYIRAEAYHQTDVFEAAVLFARTEGFVIAPETAHALKGVVDEAIRCRESGEEKTIFFLNSGHGHFDLSSYAAYFEGKLVDYEYPAELVKRALENLPKVGV
ncbi:MAG TPA: TrpB-like pyridoxal phosphate-dependent enzyme [Candidatus Syntrophoarchaeum butanivorans]|uniref:Tryptophan synthase beta chain n=1 Tax=Candidatus Syntropharchaeum butanivorans TaxID=1839936 RepID=A0A1F2P777_9EURY|nr:MAG: tryptophan synthase subunit beta [Candidatus Syntrophoarchaeum butanivorans]HEC57606.1 TrpB-like pyridoxal phosphate-dependent enzyme [Candidatus Syntrophoarchaeum butanivorans]